MRIWECDRRTSTLDRVGEGSSPQERLAGFDEAEGLGGVDAERLQHFGRENFPHAPLEREPTVAAPRPGRLAAALGAEIEQPAVLRVAQLREQEAAAVSELGVVNTELMAVVAQRQRLREAARQGLETAEMRQPLRLAQHVEPDARGPALVAEAQNRFRERRCFNAVEEGVAEALMKQLGAVAFGDGHGGVSMGATRREQELRQKNKAEKALRLLRDASLAAAPVGSGRGGEGV
jgi:hypothetical protein